MWYSIDWELYFWISVVGLETPKIKYFYEKSPIYLRDCFESLILGIIQDQAHQTSDYLVFKVLRLQHFITLVSTTVIL